MDNSKFYSADTSIKVSDINSARTLAERTELAKKISSKIDMTIPVSELTRQEKGPRNYDKNVVFQNIRELLNDKPDVKLGKIEEAAGLNPGYMARLEKDGNKTEPSMSFIVTAAKMLNVSVDFLVTVNLTELSAPERYTLNFLDKLKMDTLNNKLDWDAEYKTDLWTVGVDRDGDAEHPLFSYETFFREGETDYPDQVTEVVFKSHTFGCNTAIPDDGYKLRLKNGAMLYLMSMCKDVFRTKDAAKYTGVEIWMVLPNAHGYLCDKRYLCSSFDKGVVGEAVTRLYDVVKNYMMHPKMKSDIANIIDAFMEDDLSDDEPRYPDNMFDGDGNPTDIPW